MLKSRVSLVAAELILVEPSAACNNNQYLCSYPRACIGMQQYQSLFYRIALLPYEAVSVSLEISKPSDEIIFPLASI